MSTRLRPDTLFEAPAEGPGTRSAVNKCGLAIAPRPTLRKVMRGRWTQRTDIVPDRFAERTTLAGT